MAESGGTGGDTHLESSLESYRELPVDVEGLDEADGSRGRKKKGDSRIIQNGTYISKFAMKCCVRVASFPGRGLGTRLCVRVEDDDTGIS